MYAALGDDMHYRTFGYWLEANIGPIKKIDHYVAHGDEWSWELIKPLSTGKDLCKVIFSKHVEEETVCLFKMTWEYHGPTGE